MRVLVWFRSDLRVEDNTALSTACATATGGVIAVFLIAAEQWRSHDWGDPKTCFVLRGVRSLGESLSKLNIPLLIRAAPLFSDAAAVLGDICAEHSCDAVYWNKEYELNEVRRDEHVSTAITRSGRRVREFDDQVLIPPGTLRTGEGRYYTVYTPFRKAATARLVDSPPTVVAKPRRQQAMPCDSDLHELLSTPEYDEARSHQALWPATEREALKRLQHFCTTAVATYKSDRDFPSTDGTSTLSPYLSAGMISPRQCASAAVEANGGIIDGGSPGPSTWISELLWREFYRHLIFGFPRLSMGRAFKPATEQLRWETNPQHLEAWKAGRTGVPIVDAGMRQLAQTGWMHNRCRMIVAMYLSKHLFISWREGERHFMQSLVDADLAQNNGGWQWAASTGTDAAPYFRIFNYASQAKRYDPEGDYIRRWVPELRAVPVQDLFQLSEGEPSLLHPPGYPTVLVDHSRARARVMAVFAGLRS